MEGVLPMASSWSGIIYRSTTEKYARSEDLISGAGAMKTAGRWNPPGQFRAVYGSLGPEVAMAEVLAQARYYGLEPWRLMRRIFCAIEVELSQVLDLTRGDIRRRLMVSVARMTRGDWRRWTEQGQEALSQALGRGAFRLGLEGIVVPSAAVRGGRNLVILPANLRPGSRVREVTRATG